ncbi:MAG: peptidylprolyl isomerase [Patescibacteria group bacterium]|nr:peptidylprolyl isomerase [Patescibacteria group bacterium]
MKELVKKKKIIIVASIILVLLLAVVLGVIAINKIINENHFKKRWEAKKHYYKTQKNFDVDKPENAEEMEKLKQKLSDELIVEAFIRKTLAKHKIKIGPEEINQEFNKSITGKTIEEAEKRIQELYGWGIEDFKKEIIKPYLEKQKLQEIIAFDEEINRDQIQKANSILEELKRGADFAEMANKYSEDPGNYPDKGGDLGWFGRGQMVKEFEEAAFALNVGEISDIVTTKFGFHIIKVEDKKENSLHARHILIKNQDFNLWLESQLKK